MSKPILGLWIDDSPRAIAAPSFWDSVKRLGFRTVALMLESTGVGFDPRYPKELLEQVGVMCRERDIELVLTVWPEPRSTYLAQMVEKLPPLLRASGAAGLEFDAEGNWIGRKVVGFKDLDEASDALVSVCQKFRELDVRSELTTFTMHGENSRRAVLADDVDRLLPQAYSVRNRKNADGSPLLVGWEHEYGPGRMQELTLRRALQVPRRNGKPALAVGLAAYDQEWPGRDPVDAMSVAYEAALRFEPVEVRWWSSKWVLGSRRSEWAERFFERLAGIVRRTPEPEKPRSKKRR